MMGAVDHNATRTIRDLRARIEELERESKQALIVAKSHIELEDDLERVQAERDTLRAYGTCLPGCNWHDRNDPKECDCGWYELKATWDPETRKALEAE